ERTSPTPRSPPLKGRASHLLLALALGFGFAFASLDGRDFAFRRRLFLFGLHRRRSDDGGNGEVFVRVGRSHAIGQLHSVDVNRIADLEPIEGNVDLVGNARRVAYELQLVLDNVQDAAALQAGRGLLVVEPDR